MDAVNVQSAAAVERRGWEVWLRWVIYTTLGYFIIGAVTIAVFQFTPVGLFLSPVAGTLGMVVVGLLQWTVLQRSIRDMRWLGWVLAAVLGQFVGAIMATIVAILLAPLIYTMLGDSGEILGGPAVQFGNLLVAGTVLGTVIGFIQWLVLRRYLQAAAWWIPAMAVAMAITSVVSMPWPASVGIGGLMAVPLTKGLTGIIVGAITGIALVWLLRKKDVPSV